MTPATVSKRGAAIAAASIVRAIAAAIGLTLAAACTPGGSAPAAGSGGTVPTTGKIVTVDVSLTLYPRMDTSVGSGLGYSPESTHVNVGDSIVFVNLDSFANTATLILGAQSFPQLSPLSTSATTRSGGLLSQPWSTGALTQAGSTSQPILVDRAGVYLYGCFYHYDGGMRAAIIAQ